MSDNKYGMIAAGGCAGFVNGLFGGGGGMVLVPLLGLWTTLDDREVFSGSIAIILPICLVSLTATALTGSIPWAASLPYLAGSGIGGFCACRFGKFIPTSWLHRGLGVLILWGGIRYLC